MGEKFDEMRELVRSGKILNNELQINLDDFTVLYDEVQLDAEFEDGSQIQDAVVRENCILKDLYYDNMCICSYCIDRIFDSFECSSGDSDYRHQMYSDIVDPMLKIFWTARERRSSCRLVLFSLRHNASLSGEHFGTEESGKIRDRRSVLSRQMSFNHFVSRVQKSLNIADPLLKIFDSPDLDSFEDVMYHSLNDRKNLINLFERVIKANEAVSEPDSSDCSSSEKTESKRRKEAIQSEYKAFVNFCRELEVYTHGIFTYSLMKNKDDKANLLVEYLIGCDLFLSTKQYLYIYEEEKGYYRCLANPKDEEEAVLNLFPDERQRLISSQVLREVIFRLSRVSSVRVDETDFNRDEDGRYVNCLNCVFDLEECRPLYGDRKKYRFNYCNNAVYSEKEVQADSFSGYVDSSLGYKGAKRFLLRIIGNLCCPSIETKNAFFFVGEPNSGKSKLGNVIKDIVGENAVSGIALHDLGERFSNSLLSSVRLNINMEMSSKPLRNIAAFKTITGGDWAKGERKSEALFTFTHHCKLLFAGNRMPELKDPDISDAFVDRIVLLYFPRSIPREEWDPQLNEKLLREKNAIFTLALREMSELYTKHLLDYKVFQPRECKEFLKEYEERTTRIPRFISVCCEKTNDEDDFTSTDDLFEAYLQYNGVTYNKPKKRAYEKRKFSEIVGKQLGYRSQNGMNRWNEPVKGYKGIIISDKYREAGKNTEEYRWSGKKKNKKKQKS